jgi:intergrase/recombinase
MLDALLEKLKLKSPDELTTAERETYRQWSEVLAKQDVSIDDLKKILPRELERAHVELRKFENSKEKDMFYKAYAELCENISKIIIAPQQQREHLRSFLKNKFGIE